MRRIRRHLTYSNVMVTILAFIVLTGGTAVALSGSNTVFTDDIANDTQPPSGGNPAGGLAAADLRPNSVGSSEVANESLTGADIANKSGVDTCVNTNRLGNLCVRAENQHRTWLNAVNHCANLGLRVPSLGEALELAKTHDIPNVDQDEFFWTEDKYYAGADAWADRVDDAGDLGGSILTSTNETVCVTTPTN